MQRRKSYPPVSRPAPPAPAASAVRAHTSLPLLHDFEAVYGVRDDEQTEYVPGRYPWRNSPLTRAALAAKVRRKEVVKLGTLPAFRYVPPTDGMNQGKRDFFAYMLSGGDTVANRKQIAKDVPRNAWMHAWVPRLLELVFVRDPTWDARYPLYVQGMDRVVHSWRVRGTVQESVHVLRLLLLALEFVYRDDPDLNSVSYLGRISPWETIDERVETHQILPIFETLNELDVVHPHDAYHVAVQLKAFYDRNRLSKVRHFLTRANTLDRLRDFLRMEEGMVTERPELLLTFRASSGQPGSARRATA